MTERKDPVDRNGGMGPRFNYDLAALRDAMMTGYITHEEARKCAAEKLGLPLGEWPEGKPRPLMLWELEMLRTGLEPRPGDDPILPQIIQAFSGDMPDVEVPEVPRLRPGWLSTTHEESA